MLQALRTLWTHLGNITADQVSGLGSMAGPAVRGSGAGGCGASGSSAGAGAGWDGGGLSVWARIGNVYFLVERWFHGAFLDARKQDAIDLMTGTYQVGCWSGRKEGGDDALHLGQFAPGF